jgi:hypothetical protein
LLHLLMVQLVLLPMYGAWFNEDFAALQPTHDHIYLDGIKPNHHADGKVHSADPTEESDGVINLPDKALGGLGLVFLLFLVTAVVKLPDNQNGLHSPLSMLSFRLSGIFPPPLIRPPRI